MKEFSVYVGLDVHKDTIAVAIVQAGRSEPRYSVERLGTGPRIRQAYAPLRL